MFYCLSYHRNHTRKPVVVSVGGLVVDKDGVRAIFVLETLLHSIDFVRRHFESRPAIPLEARRFAKTTETSDEAARRHGEGVGAIVASLDGDGQSVGQKQQAAGSGLCVRFHRRHLDCEG